VWKIMQEVKQKSTVLLTTHAMEEADNLGDQIGIMASGSLKGFGTSLQLKHEHGNGYSLQVVKRATSAPSDAIVACVRSCVETAVLRTDAGQEIQITLPIDSAAAFPQLFRQLEARSEELQIATFGLAQTSLEEVFLKLAGEAGEDDDESSQERGEFTVATDGAQVPLPSFECEPTFAKQLGAILLQVAITSSRHWVGMIHGIIAPVL